MKVILTLLKQIKRYWPAVIATPVVMLLEVVAETILPKLMGTLVDNGVNPGNMGYICKIGVIMLVVAVGALACGFMGGWFGSYASAGFAKNLRDAMFGNIQTYAFSNIDKYSTAGLITRMTTDVTNLQNAMMMILRMGMRAPASLIVCMIFAFAIDARIAKIYLVAVIALAIVVVAIMLFALRYFNVVFEKYDEVNSGVQENVSGMRLVKAYVREEYETSKFAKASANLFNMFVKAERLVVVNMPTMMLTVYVCIIAVSWVGAHMVVEGSLTTGNLMTLLTYCATILMNLMMLSMVFVMIAMSAASGKRISEVINEETDIKNPKDAVTEVADGSIVFDHVNFAYNKDAKENVLHDINIAIRSGETIGIIGGTGSAKTSLVNLLSRLYDVTEGNVIVGGRDVREYDLKVLRDSVSVVLQKNTLFRGSVMENLRWGDPEADEEKCRRICKIACADDFISALPEGYNSHVEQGGANFSGGQRQRLCIARALMKEPKILILDDSTSAVDMTTDAKIRKAFAEDIPNTTKLIIAQRIDSVKDADRIMVMHEGRLIAAGTHEELLASNDIYREVYESQRQAGGDFDEKKQED